MTEQSLSNKNAVLLAIFVVVAIVGGLYLNVNLYNERLREAEETARVLEVFAEFDANRIDSLKAQVQKLQGGELQKLKEELAEKKQTVRNLKEQLDHERTLGEDKYIELWKEHMELRQLVMDADILSFTCNCTVGN